MARKKISQGHAPAPTAATRKDTRSDSTSRNRTDAIRRIRDYADTSAQQRERKELAGIKQKLRARRPLTDDEQDLLLRVVERREEKTKPGRRPMLSKFHLWIAVHYQLLRGSGDKPDIAAQVVAPVWGVSKTAVLKYAGKHEREAKQLIADVCGSLGPSLPPDGVDVLNVTIEAHAEAFRKLGELDVAALASRISRYSSVS